MASSFSELLTIFELKEISLTTCGRNIFTKELIIDFDVKTIRATFIPPDVDPVHPPQRMSVSKMMCTICGHAE